MLIDKVQELLPPRTKRHNSLSEGKFPSNRPIWQIRRFLVVTPLTGSDRTITILYAHSYADPTDRPNQWMAILTKTLLMQ